MPPEHDEDDEPRKPTKPLGDGTAPLPGLRGKKEIDKKSRPASPTWPPLRCLTCGSVFATDSELQEHVRDGHEPGVL